jgi:hypothetical protein
VNEDNKVYCHECTRGGNGNDKDKCSCGWQQKKKSSLGCYLGTKIEPEITIISQGDIELREESFL